MERLPFSKYIAARRAACGLSQKDLAEALSYTPQAISRFESLNSGFPLEYLDTLCETLDVSMDDLFFRRETGTKDDGERITCDSVASLLKSAREKSGLTQSEVAERCGVSLRSVRNFEQGQTIPSWQVIEAFCDATGFTPSSLCHVLDVTPVPTSAIRPRLVVPFRNSFALAAVVLCLILLVLPEFQSVAAAVGDSSFPVAESSDTWSGWVPSTSPLVSTSTPRYGLDMEDGVSGFFALEAEKLRFDHLGETIEFAIVDPYDGHDLADTLTEDDFSYTAWPYDSGAPIDVTFVKHHHNRCSMTLNNARNGDAFSLLISIRGIQGELGVFYYWSGEDVYLASDTERLHPFHEGRAINSGKTETTVNMNASRAFRAHVELWGKQQDDIDMVWVSFYALCNARHSDHAVIEYTTLAKNTYQLPVFVESEEMLFLYCVTINDNGVERPFALEPLLIHLVWN